jgi:hypothetical protein
VVRVPADTHAALTRLAGEHGTTVGEELARAVREYEEALFFKECDEAYARLQADPAAWADYQREFEEWDRATIADGLADWPWYEDDADGDPAKAPS